MMRNKTASSLQKTYDECYLICSTAVYFESQGNEAEALRSWRSALDQICYHNAYRMPSNYRLQSETEKTLKESLRDMEIQCKERVDLLEALRQSRLESKAADEGGAASSSANGKLSKALAKAPRPSPDSDVVEKGWIGDGTIPAANYLDLSRSAPPLPQRSSIMSRNGSENEVVGKIVPNPPTLSSSSRTASMTGSTISAQMKKASRSPSPEKGRSMLTTLRPRKGEKRSTMRVPPISESAKTDRPVPSKAATLAWVSVGRSGRDGLGRDRDAEFNNSTTTLDSTRRVSIDRPRSSNLDIRYDSTTRTLVNDQLPPESPIDLITGQVEYLDINGRRASYLFLPTDPGQPGAVAGSKPKSLTLQDYIDIDPTTALSDSEPSKPRKKKTPPPVSSPESGKLEPLSYSSYFRECPEKSTTSNPESQNTLPIPRKPQAGTQSRGNTKAPSSKVSRKPVANSSSPRHRDWHIDRDEDKKSQRRETRKPKDEDSSSLSIDDHVPRSRKRPLKQEEVAILAGPITTASGKSDMTDETDKSAWEQKVVYLMNHLPKGIDEGAAKQILNEIVVQGDEVHWDDVVGLEIAKTALKEAVVYPFLRPDLFMGLREPARGMLLFGPPGTGKTMLARAVATESRSTFFSISASSLTSKYLGESEKLVRALFSLAKALAPSIIFVDEIDSLLSSRSGNGEHEATRRIKTEFLIQWSDLQRAAAGREQTEKERERGDASRVLVLAATNLPWAIDEAARRRFVRRQYIPLPENETRAAQLRRLLGHQKHSLDEQDIQRLVKLTDGFSGSDITALAKDAAMGPLRSLGEALLHMSMDQIRPIQFEDFDASLTNIRPSVSKQGLKAFEDWAKEYGERGG